MLKLDAIDAGYGGFQALFGVSMEVNAGEAVAVIGANGAGKTTLLRVISGLLPPTSGTMVMEGRDLVRTPAHKIIETGIAHVPESRRLFPRLTVHDNLRMGAFIPGARARFSERLDYVYTLFPRLQERQNQMAGTLSGGEQQMLAIGRALMMRPTILLLDEPSMGLAPILVEQVFETIQEINKEGVTIFLVEQNANVALSIADRGYVLQTGRIVMHDTAKNLLANPELSKAYLGELEG